MATLKPLKSKKEEGKLKEKHLKDFVFKAPHQSREKNMTSLLPSYQKSEGESYSVMRECNSEMNPFDHVSQHTNNIYTLKTSKTRKEGEEVKFKCLWSTNCDVIVSDVIITEPDSDVITRDVEVNKPVAGKRYAQKHSLVSKKGFLKSSLRVCSRTFTKVALMLAIVISILGGVFNIKLPERKSTIGTSSSLSLSKPRVALRCHGYAILFLLTLTENVLAGKRLVTYISPFTDFWASRAYYLDTYTVNLESDYNFTVFYNLRYIYIYFLPFVVVL